MLAQATILYAGLLTLIYIWLTINVIRTRRRVKIALGTAHPALERAVRAHANFAEYTPLFLILLYLEETTLHWMWASYLLGGLFVAGRLAHAYSILAAEPRAMLDGKRLGYALRFRFYAMTHTFIPIVLLAILLLVEWGMAVAAK